MLMTLDTFKIDIRWATNFSRPCLELADPMAAIKQSKSDAIIRSIFVFIFFIASFYLSYVFLIRSKPSKDYIRVKASIQFISDRAG